MNDVICIIGMHRSGTSMVTRLLNLCGLYLGSPEMMLGPDPSNPMGHFENIGFLKIDDALLSRFGASWDNPPAMPEGWERDAALEPFIRDAESLLANFGKDVRWGWKEPRTTLLLPFWKMMIPNLRFIVCVRSPLEVARSLEKRNAMPVQKGLKLWNQYMRAAILGTEGSPRSFTFYEDFFDEPLREIRRLLNFCGLEIPSDASVIFSTISDDFRRNIVALSDLLKDESVLPEYKLFYLGLRALSLERSSPDKRDALMSEGFDSLTKLINELHSKQKVAQLQTILVEREFQLRRLTEENETLRLSLDNVKRTLTWQLMAKLDRFKERSFPTGTFRRGLYDRFLVSIKKLVT